MTANDPRYTINQEYTGEPGPRYVARFCRVWISSHDTAERATCTTRPGCHQCAPSQEPDR